MTFFESFSYKAISALSAGLAAGGFGAVSKAGDIAGDAAWYLAPRRRAIATGNIMRNLELPAAEAERLAHESFRQNFRSFLELTVSGRLSVNDDADRLIYDDKDLFFRMINSDRPIVAATAHFGAWELLAGLLGEVRLYVKDRPLLLIVRKYPNEGVQKFIGEKRCIKGIDMAGNKAVATSVLRNLRQGGITAFLVDHKPHKSEALWLPFLGQETAVNMGPALLGTRTDSLIMPIFLAREGKKYRLIVNPPLDTALLEGDRREKVRAAAQFYTDAIADIVKRYPEQWFWMHDRWSPPV